MKNILYVENGVGFGGAVTSLKSFLDHLDRDRYRPILVHSLDDPKFEQLLQNVTCLHLPLPSTYHTAKNHINRFFLHDKISSLKYYLGGVLPYAFQLARLIQSQQISLVHLNNDINCNLAGIYAAKLTRRPCVLHERTIVTRASTIVMKSIRLVNAFIAISGVCRNALTKIGIPEKNITVAYEGFDFENYMPVDSNILLKLRAEMGLAETTPLVVMAGVLMPWKGQHILLRAAKEVIRTIPECRFVIVGEDPKEGKAYFAELKKFTENEGLSKYIIFTGFRKDVLHFMQMADVVVHASTSPEPFGRVIIEAMAMERPVISTTIGAPAEIIEHGKTGYLIQPSDADRLADAIKMLLNGNSLCRTMGKTAREHVRSKYSIENHVCAIEELYESLLH